jgi:hypothetical protein
MRDKSFLFYFLFAKKVVRRAGKISMASTSRNVVSRTTPQLYRDCLRLVEHIAGRSKKGQALKGLIRNEFQKNLQLSDPVVVETLKSNAIRGLANYLMMESANKDPRLKTVATEFAARTAAGSTSTVKEI